MGSSGPTLNPRDSIRYARQRAIESLASGSLEIDVQTVSSMRTEGRSFEMSAQSLSGVLADARIVSIFADTNATGSIRSRVRQVYALACWPDASLRGVEKPGYPEWLLDAPREAGRICASGIAGPTRNPLDQPASALRDARLALAVAIESEIEKRIFDSGQGAAKVARKIKPSADALARASEAEALEEEWLDTDGRGPIGLPGILYGLACIED